MEKKLKFFAKYIPVEGKIEDGDKYLAYLPYGNEILTKNGKFPTDQGRKKVKLFLCSRDIQIGDKYKVEIDGNGNLQEFIYSGEEGEIDGNCFKVIGEISPDCNIKERQEFDESQISLVWICNQHRWRDCSCKSNLSQGVIIKS